MSSHAVWGEVAIGTSATLLSPTVNTGDEVLLDSVWAFNTSGATVTIDWYLVPAGGSVGSSNLIEHTSLTTNTGALIDGLLSRVIEAGGTVHATASATGVNTWATGRVRQP